MEGETPNSYQILSDEVFEDEHNINASSLLVLLQVHFDDCPSNLHSPPQSEAYQAAKSQICSLTLHNSHSQLQLCSGIQIKAPIYVVKVVTRLHISLFLPTMAAATPI